MSTWLPQSLWPVLYDITKERESQDKEWGQQNHPDGTGPNLPLLGWPKQPSYADLAFNARLICNEKHKRGKGTWLDILLEEVFEAAECTDPAKLREELIQVAAVATAWAERIDRRTA